MLLFFIMEGKALNKREKKSFWEPVFAKLTHLWDERDWHGDPKDLLTRKVISPSYALSLASPLGANWRAEKP